MTRTEQEWWEIVDRRAKAAHTEGFTEGYCATKWNWFTTGVLVPMIVFGVVVCVSEWL